MNTKNVVTSIVISVIVVFLGFIVFGGNNVVTERVIERLGVAAGPTHTERQVFLAGFDSGSSGTRYATSSTASAYTLTSTELGRDIDYISWNAGLDLTLTTPASTTLANIMGSAHRREYLIYSATTTAATTITLAAGSGVDLQEDEGETVIINGLEVARLTLQKKADTDIIAWLEVGQVGD